MAVQVGAELGFGADGLGVAIAVLFGASALSSPIVFRIIERIGAYAGVIVTSVAAGASMLSMALLVRSYTGLLVTMVLGGVANGFGQPAANGLLARGLRPGRQGLAFGSKQAAVPLTSLVAGATVPLVALTVGWRWAYAGVAVLVLLVPFLVPRQDGSARPQRDGVRPNLSAPLWLLTAASALGAAATMTLASFTVDSLVSGGVSESSAGILLVYGSAVSITTRLLFGWAADRWGFEPALPMIAAMVSGAGGVALLGIAEPTWPLVTVVAIAFGAGWGWNGLMDLTVVGLHRASPAAASSMMMAGSFVGATVGQLGFGLVAANVAYRVAWLGAATVLLAGAGCAVLARRLAERA